MRSRGIRSVREMARAVASHDPTLYDWMTGKRGLSKAVGRRVAVLLGVPLETVLFDWSPSGLARPKRRGRSG